MFIFIQLLRPSTDGKVYLFLYDLSIARGSNYTRVVSIREMQEILGMQKSSLHEAISRLRNLGALEVYELLKNEGTRYTVKLPVWTGNLWEFVSARSCPYLYRKLERVDESNVQDVLGFW